VVTVVEVSTLDEALAAVGHPGIGSSRSPILRSADATLITLATLDADGRAVWHGLWISGKDIRPLGAEVPPSLLVRGAKVPAPTAALVNLLQAAQRSYVENLETLGGRLDALELRPDPAPLPDLSSLLHAIAGVRKQIVRLEVLVAELDGPLGESFDGLADLLPPIRVGVSHLDELSNGIAQGTRDLISIRDAVEANRLAAFANQLGTTSNRIAELANTSNIRMLGVAYIALVIAIVSVVVLIPNTGATILGMPSAAWVPGWWVDLILIVLAIIPAVIVFSRPWVLRTLRGLPSSETRTSEGLLDLPEETAPSGPSTSVIPPTR
jgi:hypothetical protein